MIGADFRSGLFSLPSCPPLAFEGRMFTKTVRLILHLADFVATPGLFPSKSPASGVDLMIVSHHSTGGHSVTADRVSWLISFSSSVISACIESHCHRVLGAWALLGCFSFTLFSSTSFSSAMSRSFLLLSWSSNNTSSFCMKPTWHPSHLFHFLRFSEFCSYVSGYSSAPVLFLNGITP